MNVDFLIKTNPFNVAGIQTQKTTDSKIKKSKETAQNAPVAAKAPSGANFVQKIKDTNDAMGFIQTEQAFLARLYKESVTDFAVAKEIAANMSFSLYLCYACVYMLF